MSVEAGDLGGFAEDGFGRVADAFAGTFPGRDEAGAALAVYRDGRPVVDLWGGLADRRTGMPWGARTPAVVFSCTKGMMAVAVYRLVDAGRLELDVPVARYWPEFGRRGKESTTVRMLLSHRAGLPVVDEPLDRAQALAWEPVIRALEDQAPLWRPGTAHTYHAKTFGWLVGEVVRRATGMTPGTWFARAVAAPLGLEAWIGLPEQLHGDVARTEPPEVDARPGPDWSEAARMVQWRAVTLDGTFPFPGSGGEVTFNDPEIRAAELPGGNGIATARGLARMYAACVGSVDGVRLMSQANVADALVEQSGGPQVFGSPIGGFRWGTGFQLDAYPWCPMFGPRSFGHDGAGGQLAFADADRGIGFAYVTAQMGGPDDMRSRRLVAAVREALGG